MADWNPWRDMQRWVREFVSHEFYRRGFRGSTLDAGSISGVLPVGSVGGVGIDHGGLTGLGDDDHPQYTTATEATTIADAEIATHAGQSDPHTGYVLESLLDAKGDLYVASADNTPGRLAVGTNGKVLKANSAQTLGVEWADDTGFANPMTTAGDLIMGGASGAPGRLAIGTTGQVLTVSGGAPAWADAVGFSADSILTDDDGNILVDDDGNVMVDG